MWAIGSSPTEGITIASFYILRSERGKAWGLGRDAAEPKPTVVLRH